MTETTPLINDNAQLQSYYASLESRIGYKFLLNDTRHFGFWDHDTWWPFPLRPALRSMEDRLGELIALPPDSYVLDAGCGYGHVAIHMARRFGLRIRALDVVQRHVNRAQRNVQAAHLDKAITVRRGDYHHLEEFPTSTFDGIYTMETVVHATDPKAVMEGFYRVLRPGGRLAMHEYAHIKKEGTETPAEMKELFGQVNKYAAMPANADFGHDTLQRLLTEAGFVDVKVADYTENVMPMLQLFYFLAYIPYLIIRFFGLEPYFINTVAGIVGYRFVELHRYYAISATKPEADGGRAENEVKKDR